MTKDEFVTSLKPKGYFWVERYVKVEPHYQGPNLRCTRRIEGVRGTHTLHEIVSTGSGRWRLGPEVRE